MEGNPLESGSGLHRQLHKLLANARDNEEKQRRLNALEFRLIATTSLAELVQRVVAELPHGFGLDYVTLALLDPEQEIAHALTRAGLDAAALPELLTHVSSAQLAPMFTAQATPTLGPFAVRRHGALFPDEGRRPASVALLPLVRRAELIGSLNLGSRDLQRFSPETSSDFLERLAAITAICLENGIIYERLKQLGFTDPLTGVNNRRYFEERLTEEWAAAVRHQQPLACMFLDVDHFKRFNDRYGHQAGDQALREVAQVIREQLRRSDTFSRYGGEEFVVLMPEAPRDAALDCAERIRRAVARHGFVVPTQGPVTITISIGVASHRATLARNAAQGAAALLGAADQAAYQAKAAGRNRVVLADAERANPPLAKR